MASTYLSRTISSGSDITRFTYSFWVKRSGSLGSYQRIISNSVSSSKQLYIRFTNSDTFEAFHTAGGTDAGSYVFYLSTTAKFRDVSAWYHIVVKFDSTQSTEADRTKIYVNGNETTALANNTQPSQNEVAQFINTGQRQDIGTYNQSSEYFDGYMAHLHFTDGYAYAASTFGSTATNGQWVPNVAPSVTYGTNGYFLKFTNGSDLGEDSSGNNNDFTKTGSGDKVLDNPDNVFASLNPLYKQGSPTFSEGNTKVVLAAGDGTQGAAANLAPPAGKWYWEIKQGSSTNSSILVREASDKEDDLSYYQGSYAGYELNDGNQRVTGSTESTYGASYGNGDIIMVALDMDNDRVYFGKNGLWADGNGNSNQSSLNDFVPLNGVTNGVPAVANANGSASATFQFNFGNPAYAITSGNADENGYGNFEYAPPTGYLALCTKNLATELTLPIGKGGSYFKPLTYTGNGTSQTVTGVGFQPDFVWIKNRSQSDWHNLVNIISGATRRLSTNNTTAEYDNAQNVSAFTSDGFSVGNDHNTNANGENYVSWNWLASNSTASNTDGTNASTVSVNQTAGFSIVSYTRDGNSTTTVGHGLGKTPKVLIEKDRDTASTNWSFITTAIDGTDDYSFLNTTNAFAATTANAFTTTTFRSSMGANQGAIISYVFAEIEGYSKFGSYTGNGSTDGAFVYTGFRPSFFMTKPSSTTGEWTMYDNTRSAFNVADHRLAANDSYSEYNNGNGLIDFLSNGFKMRVNHPSNNTSGVTYIYMAFAKNPFVDSSGIPVTAR